MPTANANAEHRSFLYLNLGTQDCAHTWTLLTCDCRWLSTLVAMSLEVLCHSLIATRSMLDPSTTNKIVMCLWRCQESHIKCLSNVCYSNLQNLQGFPKFLSGGEFRCFKIKQIELIQEIQKNSTTFVSESFWMKILPLNSRWKFASTSVIKIQKEWSLSVYQTAHLFYGWFSEVAFIFTKYYAHQAPRFPKSIAIV